MLRLAVTPAASRSARSFIPARTNCFTTCGFLRGTRAIQIASCVLPKGRGAYCHQDLSYRGPQDNSNIVGHFMSVHLEWVAYEELKTRGIHPVKLIMPPPTGQALLVSDRGSLTHSTVASTNFDSSVCRPFHQQLVQHPHLSARLPRPPSLPVVLAPWPCHSKRPTLPPT